MGVFRHTLRAQIDEAMQTLIYRAENRYVSKFSSAGSKSRAAPKPNAEIPSMVCCVRENWNTSDFVIIRNANLGESSVLCSANRFGRRSILEEDQQV